MSSLAFVGNPSALPVAAATIVALSSGSLPSGVAVVRASGPGVRFVLETIIGGVTPPRIACLRDLFSPDGELLDTGLVIFFPGPKSFSGEDLCEFHVHGGRAVVTALIDTICTLPGCRVAEPGEFTRRALVNGKTDLMAAEAVADLIQAETEAQRRFAVFNARGGHKVLYGGWRQALIHARAMIEAELDFSDEADVPGSLADQVWDELALVSLAMRDHASSYEKAEVVHNGYQVVLLGAPNAGKSSLLNALVNRDVAIVTPEAGTTRDAIDAAMDLGGVRVVITDTAGVRVTEGLAERAGIERSIARAETADLILLVEDSVCPVSFNAPAVSAERLTVGTKLDIHAENHQKGPYDFRISTVTGEGMSGLLTELERRASLAVPALGELVPWKARHVSLLLEAVAHLDRSISNVSSPIELRCEELRLASMAVGRIAGEIHVEDMLDVIFSQFCIGK